MRVHPFQTTHIYIYIYISYNCTIKRTGSFANGMFRNVINGRSFFPIVVSCFPLRNPVVPSTFISRISSSVCLLEALWPTTESPLVKLDRVTRRASGSFILRGSNRELHWNCIFSALSNSCLIYKNVLCLKDRKVQNILRLEH